MTIGQMPTNDNETMSILMIDSVSAYDGGTYKCEVSRFVASLWIIGYEDSFINFGICICLVVTHVVHYHINMKQHPMHVGVNGIPDETLPNA